MPLQSGCRGVWGVAALALLVALAAPARALETLKAEAIETIMSDATLQGSMSDGTPLNEYYDPDGTLRGVDFTGTWSVEDDTLCVERAGPESRVCYGVGGNELAIFWVLEGKIVGQGAVLRGNVNTQ